MYKRPLFSFVTPYIVCVLVISFGIIINCVDSLDKSPVSSIPDSQIPNDIAPVSSNNNSFQINGGAIRRNGVDLYIHFDENIKYKDIDIWLQITDSDTSYSRQEILNKDPNNFIPGITYKYTKTGLAPSTTYTVWIGSVDIVVLEEVETSFTTLLE